MAADLTGCWQGHYEQHGTTHAISLELNQEGDRLHGTMRDRDTVTEKSLFEMAAEAGLPPGADEQIVQSLREQFPDSRGQPIRARSELPSLSTIEGRTQGRTVHLLKTYQGECFVGYQVGEHLVGTPTEGHSVHYRGELSEDGLSLEGTWWIEQETTRPSGSFRLKREMF